MSDETFLCIRCGQTGNADSDASRDNYQHIMIHESCLNLEQREMLEDRDWELGSNEKDGDLCFECGKAGEERAFVSIHDDCITPEEWKAITDDQMAYAAAHEKAFPGDTYEKSSAGEHAIRQAHAEDLYVTDLRSTPPWGNRG